MAYEFGDAYFSAQERISAKREVCAEQADSMFVTLCLPESARA
jgi:hypothetical protein